MTTLQNEMDNLQHNLGIKFNTVSLLTNALTHRSYLNESKDESLTSNERLEFLGDAVLSFLVSSKIYQLHPDLPEGKLTFIRTHLVRTETLAILAEKLQLGKYLLMSKGEEQGGGKENPLLLANCFEAVLGAIYLDQGITVAGEFVERNLSPVWETISDPEDLKDSKSLFQEIVQADNLPSPVYKLLESFGPDHQKTFTMAVYVNNQLIAQGTSRSKQEAEEEAAKKALEIYGQMK